MKSGDTARVTKSCDILLYVLGFAKQFNFRVCVFESDIRRKRERISAEEIWEKKEVTFKIFYFLMSQRNSR